MFKELEDFIDEVDRTIGRMNEEGVSDKEDKVATIRNQLDETDDIDKIYSTTGYSRRPRNTVVYYDSYRFQGSSEKNEEMDIDDLPSGVRELLEDTDKNVYGILYKPKRISEKNEETNV